MRKGHDRGNRGGGRGGKRGKTIMTFLVAINVIASRPTGTPIAHAKSNFKSDL